MLTHTRRESGRPVHRTGGSRRRRFHRARRRSPRNGPPREVSPPPQTRPPSSSAPSASKATPSSPTPSFPASSPSTRTARSPSRTWRTPASPSPASTSRRATSTPARSCPDQTVEGGVVTFQIVEGKLTDVRLTGNQRLRPGYVTRRLQQSAEPVLNLVRLRDRLELLRQDPNLRSIQAELRPGLAPGEGVLDVQVNEAQPFQLGVVYSNRRPPSVGSTAIDIVGSRPQPHRLRRPAGVLATTWRTARSTTWTWPAPRTSASTTPSPSRYDDTTLSFSFSRTDSVVVETPFEDLAIGSDSDSYALTVRHPLYRRPVAEPATEGRRGPPGDGVGGVRLGRPARQPDHAAGRAVRVLPRHRRRPEPRRGPAARAGADHPRPGRAPCRVRSTFSLGLDVLGATTQRRGPLRPRPPRRAVPRVARAGAVRAAAGAGRPGPRPARDAAALAVAARAPRRGPALQQPAAGDRAVRRRRDRHRPRVPREPPRPRPGLRGRPPSCACR